MIQVNGTQILASAKANYGATGTAPDMFSSTGAPGSATETSGIINNGAQQGSLASSSGVNGGIIAGSILIGIGVVYAGILAPYLIYKARVAARTTLLQGPLEAQFQLTNENFADVEGAPEEIDVKKISWISTPDASAHIFMYDKKVLVHNKASETGKPYKLVAPPEAQVSVKKQKWYSLYATYQNNNQVLAETMAEEGEAEAEAEEKKAPVENTPVEIKGKVPVGATETLGGLKSTLSRTTLMHGAAIGGLIALGTVLVVEGNNGVLGLASSSTSPYASFISDIQSAEAAILQLQAQLATLQTQKTALVLDQVTANPQSTATGTSTSP